VTHFDEGCNCAQAVLSVHTDEFGLNEQVAFRIASGFGGGMGRMAETCGAVTGAMMVLGLRHGGNSPDRESKERIYMKIRDFAERFKARNGSLLCRDLLDCDISTPEGVKIARDKNLITRLCPKYVRDAVEILDEMQNGLGG